MKPVKKMKPEVKAKWIAALRSGKYKQGKKFLNKEGTRFCCLGVLCDLAFQDGVKMTVRQGVEFGLRSGYTLLTHIVTYGGHNDLPPRQVSIWSGIDLRDAKVRIGSETANLATHNDRGIRFETIAKAIEEQL